MNKPKRPNLAQTLPYILIGGSTIAFICSFILSYEKLQLVLNPNFVPNCNLNPVVSCGNVMQSAASAAFGFPNAWIGLAGFVLVGTVGVVLLAGATLKRWFWWALTAGIGAALVFAFWLLFESIYRIQALCPFCLAVDVVLITMFWYLVLHVLGMNFTSLPGWGRKLLALARKHHLEILTSIFLIILAIILQHFWYYYGQFI